MKPYYDRGGIVIYHGDCLDVLPTFEGKGFDCVITDPPYEAEAHTKHRRVKRGGGVLDVEPLHFPPISASTRELASSEMARLARRWVLTFAQIEAVPLWRAAQESAGLTYRRTCVWIKPDGMPQYTGDRPGMGYEAILAMHVNGRSKWNGGGAHGVMTCSKRAGNGPNVHPTEKPITLMRRLVCLFSDPGERLLDPFMGSGSTLVACKEEGRKAFGIELEEKYCEIAAKRLAQEVLFE